MRRSAAKAGTCARQLVAMRWQRHLRAPEGEGLEASGHTTSRVVIYGVTRNPLDQVHRSSRLQAPLFYQL